MGGSLSRTIKNYLCCIDTTTVVENVDIDIRSKARKRTQSPTRRPKRIDVNYPTEDQWYSCGKTKFPSTTLINKTVARSMNKYEFITFVNLGRRMKPRMIKDETDYEIAIPKGKRKPKTIDVIQVDGIKTTEVLPRKVSKESIEWFEEFMNSYDIWIDHYGNNNDEKTVRLHTQKPACVDGWCERFQMVFEYHGSFFHGDPDKYERHKDNRLTKIRFGELYTKTRNRDLDILLSGYNLCTIWGHGKERTVTFHIVSEC